MNIHKREKENKEYRKVAQLTSNPSYDVKNNHRSLRVESNCHKAVRPFRETKI